MKKPLPPFVVICALLTLLTGCADNPQTSVPVKIEPGVSLELAQHRKATISQLAYKLAMDIPAEKDADIPASGVLIFFLSDTVSDLQIDFKETTDKIISIAANGSNVPIDHRNEHIIVPGAALRKGRNQIDIKFIAGNLSLNRNNEYLYTLLVPDRARTVFPCFDQPNLKASFQLSLTMPDSWQALTNGPLTDSTIANGRKTFHFEPSDTISTYLFAFAAGKFTKVARNVEGRTMNFFHRETDQEKLTESLDTIFYLHSKALDFLEEYTAIPYPFKKFDFVAIPDFQYGGMEHVGAIQYRASSLFLDKSATESRKISRANLIAHETAHMWFGDLVTMDWFNDVWMKEVFANFMADKVSEVTFPDTGSDLKFLLNHYPAAYAVDRTPGANPIRQGLSNLQEAGSLYGNIIYHKAPIVMKQLEMLMGKDAFQQGLQQYLQKFSFSNATWTDLITILDELTSEDLVTWNQVWVEEPFRPVFTFESRLEQGKVESLTVSQNPEVKKPSPGVWAQYFNLGFGYADSLVTHPVLSYRPTANVSSIEGTKVPDYLVFNATGEGYGVFPVDQKMLPYIHTWKSPVARASAVINNYENMLNGAALSPAQLIEFNLSLLNTETEELILRQLVGQISSTFWQYLPAADRELMAQSIEERIWEAMGGKSSADLKKILFQAYQQAASGKAAMAKLYSIWKTSTPPAGIRLSEDDYTSLAATLSLLGHPQAVDIQNEQLARIENQDRKKRWEFLLPSLSSDTAIRGQFFESLRVASNREKESWVSTSLGYLHHPVRHETSVAYLNESLELLTDIQSTGDIFFPTAWLNATFGTYQSDKAAAIVLDFLQKHPDYPPNLKRKILQTTDDLNRASLLVNQGG